MHKRMSSSKYKSFLSLTMNFSLIKFKTSFRSSLNILLYQTEVAPPSYTLDEYNRSL